MLYSSYITLASLILTSSVVSAIGTLRPYIQLILPTNTVQNQTSPPAVFGALIEPIDAIQAYSFTLTLPNGTLALSAHFTLSCGTSSDPGNSTASNKITYSFDTSQVGAYTLNTTATYTIFQFNNCTGTSTNHTDFVLSSINVASNNATVNTPPSELTASLPFPSTYTGFALPYTTGTGQLNVNSTITTSSTTATSTPTSAGEKRFVNVLFVSLVGGIVAFIV